MSVVPSDISDLHVWYKADALTGILADGDRLTTWPDSSGGGRDAVPYFAFGPTFRVDQINSEPAIDFAEGNNMRSTADATYATGVTAFAVFKAPTGALLGSHNISAGGLEWTLTGDGHMHVLAQNVTDLFTDSGPAVSNAHYQIAAMSYENPGAYSFYIDGTQGGSGTNAGSLGSGVSGTAIGSNFNNYEHLIGQIAEIMTYSRVLTNTERAQIHTYLSDKYGIEVSDYITPPPPPVADTAKAGLLPVLLARV